MKQENDTPLPSNAFRLTISKDFAIFDFAFSSTDDEVLTDDNVERVASVAMPIGLLKVMKMKIDETINDISEECN